MHHYSPNLASLDSYTCTIDLMHTVADYYTVKTLYNVTRYNRIFNIRHNIAWNGSVSIKIPSL